MTLLTATQLLTYGLQPHHGESYHMYLAIIRPLRREIIRNAIELYQQELVKQAMTFSPGDPRTKNLADKAAEASSILRELTASERLQQSLTPTYSDPTEPTA